MRGNNMDVGSGRKIDDISMAKVKQGIRSGWTRDPPGGLLDRP